VWAGGFAFAGGFGSGPGTRVWACVAACRGLSAAPAGAGGFGGERLEEWPDLRPGCVEGVPGDLFGFDFDPFEERLVEEPAFGRLCLEIGVLGSVCELEREVERLDDDVVLDLVAAEEFFSGGAFASDTGLFVCVDVV
jgi:hypothetical protein